MSDPVGSTEKAIQLQNYHRRWQSQVDNTATPRDDLYEAKLKDRKARHGEAYKTWLAGLSNGDVVSSNTCQKDFDRATADLGQFACRQHQERLEKRQEDGLREHLDILGLSFSVKVYTKWLADNHAPPTPVQDQVEEEVLAANTTPSTHTETPPTNKTIMFKQLYNGGKPAKQYVIEEFRGDWYIVECEEHEKKFHVPHPLNSAQNHLRHWEHHETANKKLSIPYTKVISVLGTRVTGCTKELAEKNNAIVLGLPPISSGQPTRTRPSPIANADDNSDDDTDIVQNSSRTRRESNVPFKAQVEKYLPECGRRNSKIGGPIGNNINVADESSTNGSSEALYNCPADTNQPSPEERRSSITAGKQVIQGPVAVSSDIPFTDYDGLPGGEELRQARGNEPDLNSHDDSMEVDSRTISDSADSTDTVFPFTSYSFQLGSNNRDSNPHQRVEDPSMSDGAQAGPSSARPLDPDRMLFNARLQAKYAAAAAYHNM
ncbi:hypothetical protein FPOAC2_05310 [Fusarium poae]|uniref:hypothetical protein n=1 Tax=Fusarium poae TaxID=36050 RepID=UPI001CE9A028|nr:hypothetical protein FPOAC1_005206 [Fusarium poae]KAG8671947.1 hypothetical protein FPOAC1_005206 [Fusarium poae]